MSLLLSSKIEYLLQYVQSLPVAAAKERDIEITVTLNTNRSISTKFNIQYPIQSLHPFKNLLKKIRENIKIYQKLQRLFIFNTGIEITEQNIHSILKTLKEIDIVVSFGENYIKCMNKTSYYELYNGITYPFIDQDIKEKIIAIQKKRELNEYSYRESVSGIYNILQESCQNNKPPMGLSNNYINDENIVNGAIKEIENIFDKLIKQRSFSNKLTNLHFYINTPFFTRNSDSWPMFKFYDKNVMNICKCVQIATHKLLNENIDIKHEKFKRLNIIVRQYKYGDFLGFHSDGIMFDENICGIILKNDCPTNGLMLYHHQLKQFMIDETKNGYCWLLNDCVRWEYEHGLYIPPRNRQSEYARISISFRWYNTPDVIPPYNPQNDLQF